MKTKSFKIMPSTHNSAIKIAKVLAKRANIEKVPLSYVIDAAVREYAKKIDFQSICSSEGSLTHKKLELSLDKIAAYSQAAQVITNQQAENQAERKKELFMEVERLKQHILSEFDLLVKGV